jgi:nucleotide-binding universal stress UspA family protein
LFKNVLVGVDGGVSGRDAIALAKVLLAKDGDLSVGHIYPRESPPWKGSGLTYELGQRERAARLLDKACDEAGISAAVRWRAAASVGRGLHELAELIDADLLVIGSSPQGLLYRVLVGDATQAALNGAPCAVAIAPAGFSAHPPEMREIGVGYDGSAESAHALAVARELAAEHDTKLSAFQALDFPGYLYYGLVAPQGSSIGDLVEETRDRIRALGGVEPHAAYGVVAEELALYSDSLDLLVIGSRGYGPIGRLVHGSTSQQLARSARCPLLILPRGARQTSAAGGDQSVVERVAHEL